MRSKYLATGEAEIKIASSPSENDLHKEQNQQLQIYCRGCSKEPLWNSSATWKVSMNAHKK